MNIYQPVISGSLTVTGSTTFFGNVTINSGSLTMTSGSLSGTASLASNALLLQGTGSVGFATTASLLEVSSSQQQISSSQQQISASLLNVVANYATTGSNSFRANQSITGSLVVSSTITAQTLVVQTVTSSIVYSSGSNNFGNQLSNTQTFTGSIQASGSSNHFLLGGSVGIGTTNPIRPLHINAAADTRLVITDSNVSTTAGLYIRQFGSASAIVNNSNGTFQLATNDTYFLTANASGQVGIGTTQPSYTLDVAGTGRFTTTNTTPLILQTTAGNCGIQILTSATTHNWLVAAQYSAANTFEITPSTAVGGQTYSTPVFKITNGGAATFASSVTMGGDLVLTPNDSAISFSSGAARFFTGGQEKMRITSGNDVGFGATTITNPNSIGRVLELKLANSVGIVLNDSRDASPIGLENRGAVFHLTYGTKNLLVSDGGSGNIAIGISAAFNGERLRVGGSTSANKPAMAITSANPNVSCPSGTATTVYTFPSYPRVMFYMVFVRLDTGADANGYAAYAVVAASSVGSKLMTVVNGTYVTLTLSGLNVQINQTSGVTQNAVVSVIQIFAEAGVN